MIMILTVSLWYYYSYIY